MWLLLLACANRVDPVAESRRYGEAIGRIDRDPVAAFDLCEGLRDEDLHDDCFVAIAEREARRGAAAAADKACAEVRGEGPQYECQFQVAERTNDRDRCARAGPFADDCRMHIWGRQLGEALPPPITFGEADGRLPNLVSHAGFDPSDERPFFAAYRHLHGLSSPIELGACAAVAPARQALCETAGAQIYGDLVNHARDTGALPCPNEPLPARLEPGDHPALRRLLDERRAERCR